jgi:hypothetical protein
MISSRDYLVTPSHLSVNLAEKHHGIRQAGAASASVPRLPQRLPRPIGNQDAESQSDGNPWNGPRCSILELPGLLGSSRGLGLNDFRTATNDIGLTGQFAPSGLIDGLVCCN